jgi:hypothetical protein
MDDPYLVSRGLKLKCIPRKKMLCGPQFIGKKLLRAANYKKSPKKLAKIGRY